MKFWKLVMGSTFMFCTFFACEQETNVLMHLQYDKKKNMLLIGHAESARTLKIIELDLQQDTLVIGRIVKKFVSWNGEKSARRGAICIIGLPSNVEFVRLGDTVHKISELGEFSLEWAIEIYKWPVFIIHPRKYPITIQ